MIYEFKCDECGAEELVDRPLKEGPPRDLPCSCGGRKTRVWMTTSVIIPEHMKAENVHEFDTWKSRMEHSRPSGRGRIYY